MQTPIGNTFLLYRLGVTTVLRGAWLNIKCAHPFLVQGIPYCVTDSEVMRNLLVMLLTGNREPFDKGCTDPVL